jgi:hypothetical protein
MLMKYCEDHGILSMAYLDPTLVTEALVQKKPEETEDFVPGTPDQAIQIPTLHLQVYI